jgi:hypothetical protein
MLAVICIREASARPKKTGRSQSSVAARILVYGFLQGEESKIGLGGISFYGDFNPNEFPFSFCPRD